MKQATIKLPSGEYLIQEVPEGAFAIFINNVGCLRFTTNSGRFEHSQCIEPAQLGVYLDKESWQLLGADPTALTEEEAGKVVEKHDRGGEWEHYMSNEEYAKSNDIYPLPTATASLDSLAQSLGVSKPYVILKNKTDDNT